MPKRLPKEKQRTPVQIYVTFAQRNAMRSAVEDANLPYATYGELVMGAVHGEIEPLTAEPEPKATTGVYISITANDQAELRTLAHTDDVSIQDVVRNRLFGEAYPVRNRPFGKRRVTMTFDEADEALIVEAGECMGVPVSLPQVCKYLVLLKATEILLANSASQENAEIADKAVGK